MKEVSLKIGNYLSSDGKNLVMISTSEEMGIFYLFEKSEAIYILKDLKNSIDNIED